MFVELKNIWCGAIGGWSVAEGGLVRKYWNKVVKIDHFEKIKFAIFHPPPPSRAPSHSSNKDF
jgi:hypothetical protein